MSFTLKPFPRSVWCTKDSWSLLTRAPETPRAAPPASVSAYGIKESKGWIETGSMWPQTSTTCPLSNPSSPQVIDNCMNFKGPIVGHFLSQEHVIHKAFIRVVGWSSCSFMTLVVKWTFFCSVNLKNTLFRIWLTLSLTFRITDVRNETLLWKCHGILTQVSSGN